MPTVADTFSAGLRFQQSGNLKQAESIYREILLANPGHAEAMHYLGLIAFQVSKPQAALELISQSIRMRPNVAKFYCNLGMIYDAMGQLDKAESSYRWALKLRADTAEAYNGLGNVLSKMGKGDEAIASYEKAISIRKDYAEAHHNIANALRIQGKYKDAEARCRTALRINPEYADARNTQGMIRAALGRFEEAVVDFRKAIEIAPRDPRGHNHLAVTLQMLGRHALAVESYDKCLSLNPGYAEAHSNMGVLLQEMGRLGEAEAHLREAARLQPTLGDAWGNLGGVLQLEGKLHEAIECFRKAELLAPADPVPVSNVLLCMNYLPEMNQAALLAEHKKFGQRYLKPEKFGAAADHDRDANRRLKIGYVSADFHAHPLASFFEPILAHHDAAQLEAICYASVAAADAITARFKTMAHGWRSISGNNNTAAADLIREDKIDILVDLSGHTARNRLGIFVHKPAPIQVTYLGYPNTVGLPAIDYRLTDGISDPAGEESGYVEELVRLAHGFCAYSPNPGAPPVSSLPASRNGFITFGSLHNLPRLNGVVLDVWANLLRGFPTSRLLIFRNTLRGAVREELGTQMSRRGITPDRIDFRHSVEDGRGYLSVYDDVDIALDTFPWSGHTTACEGMWMGVPVITLRGNRHAGRMVASVLTQLGKPQWIADNADQYVRSAMELGRDIEGLARIRSNLRETMAASPLCDGKAFTRELEKAYREMWGKWCGK